MRKSQQECPSLRRASRRAKRANWKGFFQTWLADLWQAMPEGRRGKRSARRLAKAQALLGREVRLTQPCWRTKAGDGYPVGMTGRVIEVLQPLYVCTTLATVGQDSPVHMVDAPEPQLTIAFDRPASGFLGSTTMTLRWSEYKGAVQEV